MICRWVIVATLLCGPSLAFSQDKPVAQRHAQAAAEFVAQLDALAAKCDELEMPAGAQRTRDWIAPRRSGRLTLFASGNDEPGLPEDAPSKMKHWQTRFFAARQ